MTVPAHVEARMLPVEKRTRPLAEALVEIHGFGKAAQIMENFLRSPLMQGTLTERFIETCERQIVTLRAAEAASG